MELFYGHYASLEKSFIDYVASRRNNPLEPWLIVCASSLISQRLRAQLARKGGVVANMHFVTISSLLSTLDASAGPAPALFPQDHLRDFLLKDILSEPGLNQYPLSPGFVRAVKSSLRDLADSLAEPDVLEEQLHGVPEDTAFTEEQERFAWLVRVYRRFIERSEQVAGFRPYQHLFERALSQVEKSDYLNSFSNIIFYGFYDMPGRQWELVSRVGAIYPASVFAPYQKHPAYRFARKFFETNWLGVKGPHQDVNTSDFGALGESGACLFSADTTGEAKQVQIVPTADPRGEVFFAAKEILRLVEQEGFSWKDIGVIVRTLPPYQDEIRREFAQNCIAINGAFSYPLHHFALGVFCLNLFNLAAHGFERETLLAVLSSPYFKNLRKTAWRRQAEKSLAGRDYNQWAELLPQVEGFDPEFLTWLQACKVRTEALNQPRDWHTASQLARQFLQDNLDENSLQGKETEIYQKVCLTLDSLAVYESIRPQSRPCEAVKEITESLMALSFNESVHIPGGVTVTDAVRARGLQFKVVFLLGLTEKSFPQLVPEDPIFRDKYRYILRDMLGYWVNQKSERADEERLLFFAAATSAREKLYVLYSRTAIDGKETIPSLFVSELARAARITWKPDQAALVGGRLSERLAGVEQHFLTPKEISYSIVLSPATASENYKAAALNSASLERSLQAAKQIRSLGQPTVFDGWVQSGEAIFNQTQQGKGFSPSALQELASCPLKYFFSKAVHLEEPDEVYSRHALAPDKRGTAYHEILQDFYTELLRLGLTHNLFETGAKEYVCRALEKRYNKTSYRAFGIYPVIWELILEDMRQKLEDFVTQDIARLGPYTPTLFEKEFNRLSVDGILLTLRGIIDRVDIDENSHTFIVADYKSSRKGTKNLASDFFTHLTFQPFLYVLAAEKLPELKGYTSAGSCLLAINKGYDKRELSPAAFEELRPKAKAFLKQLADLIKEGTFFLSTSDLCTYCPYASICRRDSFACLMRARKSGPSLALEEARHG